MKKILSVLALVTILLTGCATSISMQVQRPAELDLNGAKSIAILPFHDEKITEFSFSIFKFAFETSSKDSEKSEISSYVYQNLTRTIAENGYYDLISSSAVENALKTGKEIPCDIYITGRIESFFTDKKMDTHTNTDALGNTQISYTFKKNISYNLTFEVIEAKTNRIIAYITNRIFNTSAEFDSTSKLPRALQLTQRQLDLEISRINRKIQPYTEWISYTLLEPKDKDETMKQASSIAKSGNLDEAISMFQQIYSNTGIMEAGYNAAILYEAMGNFEEAEKLMLQVAKESGNSKAYSALSGIQSERQKKERLEQQLAK